MEITGAIDLMPDEHRIVLGLLEKHLPNVTIWAYGSRIKSTSRPQSDLDIVVFTSPEQEQQVHELREAFEESNLPFRVEIFIWDDMPESFRTNIESAYAVLQKQQETAALPEVTRPEMDSVR